MKVAAGGGSEVGVQLRLPETVGDEVDDALFGLEGSGDAQEGGGFGQDGVASEDLGPEDEVDEAGLVLQGHEGKAAGRPGPLATDDQAGVADATAVAHSGYGAGI